MVKCKCPRISRCGFQDELLGLDHEDYGLVYILSGNLASIPQDSEERWQLGVDVIYRALICGLVKVNDLGATSDQASFLHSIRTLNPYDRSGEGYWHATLIWGAERLTKLIEAYFLPSRRARQQAQPLLHRGARSGCSPRTACRGRTSRCFR